MIIIINITRVDISLLVQFELYYRSNVVSSNNTDSHAVLADVQIIDNPEDEILHGFPLVARTLWTELRSIGGITVTDGERTVHHKHHVKWRIHDSYMWNITMTKI